MSKYKDQRLKWFTGFRWWENSNPAYRDACMRKAREETIIHTIEYNAILKYNEKNN